MVIQLGMKRRLKFLAMSLGAGLLQTLLLALPGASAEYVFVNYGLIERSISVEALEAYARTGELSEEIAGLTRYFTPEQLERLRNALLISADIDAGAVSRYLHTPQGDTVLDWLGEVVQTAGRQNGAVAIRGAIVLAAANTTDGGLNLLNVLKAFPTQGVRLDLQRLAVVAEVVATEINQTHEINLQIQAQTAATVAASSSDHSLTAQVELAVAGPYGWEKQALAATALPTDLYLSEQQNSPLVVISHGFGGDRTTLAYLAEHLASHGFAVAVVEHPDSGANQLDALVNGQAEEVLAAEDLINRPIAIQALLDDLERMTARDLVLRDRLDLQRIGVLGQSLGGYTSLALAGATVDRPGLAAGCPSQIEQLNISLLFQCSLLEIPQPLPELQDDRIQAVLAINPLNSQIFGPEGLGNVTVPIMMISGTADTITPALAEQIRPFTWLNAVERYLVLLEGGTHFSTIYNPQSSDDVDLPERVLGPNPALAQQYMKVLGVAFLKTHLTGDDSYRPYLDPAYVHTLSQLDMPLTLVRELTLAE